jgi:hypothetical protein
MLSGTLLRQNAWEKKTALGGWALTPVAVRKAQPVVMSGIVLRAYTRDCLRAFIVFIITHGYCHHVHRQPSSAFIPTNLPLCLVHYIQSVCSLGTLSLVLYPFTGLFTRYPDLEHSYQQHTRPSSRHALCRILTDLVRFSRFRLAH